jgi:hypothetical protein
VANSNHTSVRSGYCNRFQKQACGRPCLKPQTKAIAIGHVRKKASLLSLKQVISCFESQNYCANCIISRSGDKKRLRIHHCAGSRHSVRRTRVLHEIWASWGNHRRRRQLPVAASACSCQATAGRATPARGMRGRPHGPWVLGPRSALLRGAPLPYSHNALVATSCLFAAALTIFVQHPVSGPHAHMTPHVRRFCTTAPSSTSMTHPIVLLSDADAEASRCWHQIFDFGACSG